ncbi:MAG: DivIVA domain-containing protein [Actinomycetota bacterium]
MFIAPAEVQDHKLTSRLRGYNRRAVEKLLASVVASYEQVWRERDQLGKRVEQLEAELGPLRDAEHELRDVLITAERAATEIRAQAEREAAALLEQAKAKSAAQESAASKIRDQAALDAEALLEQARAKSKASQTAMKAHQTRLKNEVERLQKVEQELHANLRSFLRSGLQLVEDRNTTQPTPVPASAPSVVASVPPSVVNDAGATMHKTPDLEKHKTPDPATR